MAYSFNWLRPEAQGLYCEPGDFYIDPLRPVARAIVTHGHGDHARPGHDAVLATPETIDIMTVRYGAHGMRVAQALSYGERITIGDVIVSLAPAGHILGSAQLVIEHKSQRVVISGDYKRRPDPTCVPFEPVRCDLFITEATFGLPVFRHPEPGHEIAKLLQSLESFPEKSHIIGVYALGKCQRVIRHLRLHGYTDPIYIHGALRALCDLYARFGLDLEPLIPLAPSSKKETRGKIVLAPPGSLADRWSRGFPEKVLGLASGWMLVRQRVIQRRIELPLVISDHADWDELVRTIDEVEASTLWVTHGQEDALVHHARGRGIMASPLRVRGWGDEDAA